MSAASATPAGARARTRRASRRPGTLTVLRWELRKLRSQKRTYLGLLLAVIPPLIFVVFENFHQGPHHADSIFGRELTQSGLATPILMLLFESAFLVPLISALVAGDIVANEDGNGTLKTILTRSVDRWQVLSAKTLAAGIYALLALLAGTVVATAAGVASWGFNPLTTLSDTVVSAQRALLLVFAADLVYLIPLMTFVCIGVMFSTVTRNSAAAVVATVALLFVLIIVGSIPGLEGTRPYLLYEQFQAWQGLMRTPTDWAPIGHSAWVCALYAAPAVVLAYLVFLRRDVAGG